MTVQKLSNTKLERFGRKHLTYINQIFGDMTVREIISEVFPNKQYIFKVEQAGQGFEINTDHHILYDISNNQTVCSTKMRCNGHICQDIRRDVNDTLCQSYSLLVYRKKKIKRGKKERQIEMVRMYREILNNEMFIYKLKKEIISNNKNIGIWSNFVKDKNGRSKLEMDEETILHNIHDALNNWEDYGYMYFIGKGEVISE